MAKIWLDRVDQFCERTGDLLNPILVKETRQSLKSRQFVVTFSLILFAALGWTVIGSLSMMPGIYTSPSAPRLMIGYYVVLALPMLLVVPLAAYRSLESEIDDGTLELLSITTLSAWQIVLGKLGSASLQMMLYFVTLFPCLAFAYSLRGVDLPTTLLIVGILAVVGLLLTIVGLFFAPLARGRTGRVTAMLALLFLLILAEYGVGGLVITMILQGNPLPTEVLLFLIISSLVVSVSLGHLLLCATAAQLTPETENRSTGIRLSLLMLTTILVAVLALAVLVLKSDGLTIYFVGLILIAALWTFCGALIVGERDTITPRIRRELPNSFLGRLFLTWLTPGPTTGLVFVVVTIGWLMLIQRISLNWILNSGYASARMARDLRNYFDEPGLVLPAYLICFLVVVRGILLFVRMKSNPRVEIGLVTLVVVAMMAALVPYSMQLHYNDYQPLEYDSTWQVTNWVFTLSTAMERGMPKEIPGRVVGAAIGFGLLAVLSAWPATRPRRIATPDRVKEELGG